MARIWIAVLARAQIEADLQLPHVAHAKETDHEVQRPPAEEIYQWSRNS
jgi:hypothetical protein